MPAGALPQTSVGRQGGRRRTCEGDVLRVDEIGVPIRHVGEGDQAACAVGMGMGDGGWG